MYSYGSPHMAAQKQGDQLERTFSSYVRIQDVVLKTYLGRWTIGRSGERGSGISVLPARSDDDIYIYIYLCVCVCACKLMYIYICIFMYLTNEMKRSFFQAAVVSILLYGCTTWTLTKRLEKKLDGNYTRMLRALLNKSWRQHPTRRQLYGHLPPITKTIQVRRARHAGHCWRSKDELVSDVLLWTPTYGQAKAGRPARTYIQQLCEDTGCNPEDLPEAMNDREKWREMVKDIRAGGTTWWWYLPIDLVVRVFAKGLGDWGSISGQVIQKTQKIVLDVSLLNTQHYKVWIKSKVGKSRKRSHNWKGSLCVALD